MQSPRQTPFVFDLSGGIPCLDFANTVSHREHRERRTEHLATYADLVTFADQCGLISPTQANRLHNYAKRHAIQVHETLRQAIGFREALYRAFATIAQGKTPSAGDLQQINDASLAALQHRRLARSNAGYRWEWSLDEKIVPECLLWPIAHSAAELLTSKDLAGVRFCEAPDCEWLFLDHSRNRSRRWCDMTSCGNRQKARRHYRRAHQ